MRQFQQKRHVVDLLFTIALFCVFAASAILVVLIGAEVYKGTVRGMNDNFNTQTSLTYVAAKIRQNDTAGAVYLDEFDGIPALALEQRVGESVYRTLIYAYDGKLREMLVRKGAELEPATGNAIMDVETFDMQQLEAGLFQFTCSGGGSPAATVTVRVNCPPEGGAVS